MNHTAPFRPLAARPHPTRRRLSTFQGNLASTAFVKTPFTRGLFLAVALATSALSGPAQALTLGAGVEAVSVAFNDAVDQYTNGHWPAAYAGFAKLADSGNPEAARIALLMLRHGPRLYGQAWRASQSQIDQWLNLAAKHLSELNSPPRD